MKVYKLLVELYWVEWKIPKWWRFLENWTFLNEETWFEQDINKSVINKMIELKWTNIFQKVFEEIWFSMEIDLELDFWINSEENTYKIWDYVVEEWEWVNTYMKIFSIKVVKWDIRYNIVYSGQTMHTYYREKDLRRPTKDELLKFYR